MVSCTAGSGLTLSRTEVLRSVGLSHTAGWLGLVWLGTVWVVIWILSVVWTVFCFCVDSFNSLDSLGYYLDTFSCLDSFLFLCG